MPMLNPMHPGELLLDMLRDNANEGAAPASITDLAKRLGFARTTVSRLLHARIGISPAMALALENIGWNEADHWMRLQAAYDLAQARLKAAA